MKVRVNGDIQDLPTGCSVAKLLEMLGVETGEASVAVAVNDRVIVRTDWSQSMIQENDSVEVVHAVQGGAEGPGTMATAGEPRTEPDPLTIGDRSFRSRLILGTSRYPNFELLRGALRESGAELATVAIRRVDPRKTGRENIYSLLRELGVAVLPNTAGCYTRKEAILTAELARESLETSWIKLEVLGDDRTLYPDVSQIVDTAADLVERGFTVLPYCTDDPVVCRRLQDVGCAAVMPLASPIGSGLGIKNPHALVLVREAVSIPVIVDAGIGTASDVTVALELGLDAVLLNTAVAKAERPVVMARAMRLAAEAGRLAHVSGRIPERQFATASSPLAGVPETRFGRGGPASLLGGRPQRRDKLGETSDKITRKP